MKSETLTLVAGLGLILPLPFLMFTKDMPSELYPLPVIVAIPALLGLRYAAAAVPMLLFFLWNPALFRGEAKVPKRSYALLVAATLLSVPWFVMGWKYGLEFQGGKYNYSVLATNIRMASWTVGNGRPQSEGRAFVSSEVVSALDIIRVAGMVCIPVFRRTAMSRHICMALA